MKIAILNDMHVESWGFNPRVKIPKADAYVFAGDIGVEFNGIEFLSKYFEGKKCIYVPGNHEYYGSRIDELRKSLITETNSFSSGGVFDNQTCVMKTQETSVRFICSTLWTDFSSVPERFVPGDPFDIRDMEAGITDFRAIEDFSYKDCLRRHKESLEFVTDELDKSFDGITIVVTHFAPHVLSIAEQYKQSKLTAYFVSDLPDSLVSKANYWIHGHTHTCFDYFVGNCRVICQPFGYRHTYGREPGCAGAFKVISV